MVADVTVDNEERLQICCNGHGAPMTAMNREAFDRCASDRRGGLHAMSAQRDDESR